MKRALAFTALALLSAGLTFSQETKRIELSPTIKRIANFQPDMQEAGLMGDVVKGAPFSAQYTTETTQTLSDGTHISRTNTFTVYRDSQGRTRWEGPVEVTIYDPVANVTYELNKENKTAGKMQLMNVSIIFDGKEGSYRLNVVEKALAEQKLAAEQASSGWKGKSGADANKQSAEEQADLEKQVAEEKAALDHRKQVTENGVTIAEESPESLGTQMMEGVAADGTRRTETIPVGDIGNDRPIAIVNEQWYSPELHIMLVTRHSDPRNGETISKYSGIQRAEPDSALFQVPPGYTLREEPRHNFREEQ